MTLTTAEKYLLITERIGKKPMLRTRFTSQSYFVLAVFLDLVADNVIQIQGNKVVFDNDRQLPDYLTIFVKELTDCLAKDDQLTSALKPITSWDIANQTYDGIGAQLRAAKQVQRVIFQNNLKPHVIYEPTDSARAAVKSWLLDNFNASVPDTAALNLFEILAQMDALKWVITDEQERTRLLEKVDRQSALKQIKSISETAAEVITQKRFWLDSWLS
ncbi:hypothetical protein ACFP1H_06560 [Secundilactobacillus hailunensis]|uniref:GPP34 family phosphoprotein n=1 Tax=Secundilactobacillus hailunensis TaxID=2559923 RepID=A0ABW1T9D7_9LACO|nr:hypothetical protein [Secundilactobacillus hailunensis]